MEFLNAKGKGMKRSMGCWMAGMAVVITALMTSVAAAQHPTVVLSIRGIDSVLDDAEFIGAETGRDGTREHAEQLIGAFTGGKGLAGIDTTKPLGVYWNASARGALEMPVAFIPVSDADDLQELLTELTPDFKDSKGQWSMTVNGMKLFARVSGDYCFISNLPLAVPKLLDPGKFVNTKYDIALDVSIASIPEEFKETFLTQAEANGRQSMENSPEPDSEAERVGREIGFNATLAVLKSLVNDGDTLTLGVDVDEESRLGSMDFGITGKLNSPLAKALTSYGKTVPAFASLGSETSPFRMVVSYPTGGFIEQLNTAFKAARTTTNQQIEDDSRISDSDRGTVKRIANRLFDIAQATATSGSMHSGLVLEAGTEGKARVIGGARVAKGDEAEKLLDEVFKLAKDNPEMAKVKIDAAKHAGARIHAVSQDPGADTEKQFGDEPAHFAIRPDSLWMSIGGDNLNALKKALDAKPPTRATVAPISIRVKPAALIMLMEKDNEGLIERAEGVVGKPGDRMNLEIAPLPNGAKLRIEMGVDLLQLTDQVEE
jgi:hypothetical protein